MTTTRWKIVAVLAVAVVFGGASCGDGSGRVAPVISGSDLQDEFLVFDRLNGYLAEHFADRYSGTLRRGEGYDVYRVSSQALDRQVKAAFPGVDIAFLDVKLSDRQKVDFAKRIMGEQSYWKDQGISVASANFKIESDVIEIEIETSDQVEQAKQKFPVRYPDIAITFTALDR